MAADPSPEAGLGSENLEDILSDLHLSDCDGDEKAANEHEAAQCDYEVDHRDPDTECLRSLLASETSPGDGVETASSALTVKAVCHGFAGCTCASPIASAPPSAEGPAAARPRSALGLQLAELQQALETSFEQALALTRACRLAAGEAASLGSDTDCQPLWSSAKASSQRVSRAEQPQQSEEGVSGHSEGKSAGEDPEEAEGRPRKCSFFRRQDGAGTNLAKLALAKIPHFEPHERWLEQVEHAASNDEATGHNLQRVPRRRFMTLFSETNDLPQDENGRATFRGSFVPSIRDIPRAILRRLDVRRWSLMSFMLRPSSFKRVAWDIASFSLVGYDSMMIPLQMADPPEMFLTTVMLWITRLFWTVDIVLTFFTGYTDAKGAIVVNPGDVVRRYLRTWFGFDLVVVGLDWTEIIISSGVLSMSWARVGKATRFFRIARMLRLLRLARVQDTASTQVAMFLESLQNERLSIMMDIIKMTLMLGGISHIIACVWCSIGNSPPDGKDSWLKADRDHGDESDFAWKYSVAFHWALLQFQGGMDEVRPFNIYERVFTICCLLIGFLLATAVIGRLTSSMTQLYVLSNHNTRKIGLLRLYLKQNTISRRLAFRINRNALHAIAANESVIQEESVQLLMYVSEPLRAELHFELLSPRFRDHGLFQNITEDYPEVMSRICHQALSITEVSSGDPVFHVGERPANPKTYIVTAGELQYVEGSSGVATSIKSGVFISEAVLWTAWKHKGLLRSTSEAQLTVLLADTFMAIVLAFSLPWANASSDPRRYAVHFVNSMNDLLLDGEDINDLFTVGILSDMSTTETLPRPETDENAWFVRTARNSEQPETWTDKLRRTCCWGLLRRSDVSDTTEPGGFLDGAASRLARSDSGRPQVRQVVPIAR